MVGKDRDNGGKGKEESSLYRPRGHSVCGPEVVMLGDTTAREVDSLSENNPPYQATLICKDFLMLRVRAELPHPLIITISAVCCPHQTGPRLREGGGRHVTQLLSYSLVISQRTKYSKPEGQKERKRTDEVKAKE